ncbi:RNA degradosome polyphosphate kinase [Candidatus Planktophila versatilis]|uniref:RNA degradosome polyphosphate kinase n=1 Tax=Candidatus Planktophila versatilis TaxID=1884905 RepID=UPI000BAC9A18|nr:RNA degradosome polyphosphate kinase [Candidatus Planktophila versatilis]ASY26122.1 polyphosphate kinase [Candidatus Planktophila versatilis]
MREQLANYQDRELTWLDFDTRVLELTEDPTIPLLERVRFLSIFSSNLDEFFMVRVASLKAKIERGVTTPNSAGYTPRELLKIVLERTQNLVNIQAERFKDVIIPELAAHGIEFCKISELTEEERSQLKDYYDKRIFPVLTPLVVDPSHPFPYISGLSLNIGINIESSEDQDISFARVKIPTNLPRFIRTSDPSKIRFVLIDELIAEHLSELFPGVTLKDHFFFRVTRNQDLDLDEDETDDILETMEKELTRRRFGPPVRLEVDKVIHPEVLNELMDELKIEPIDVLKYDSPLDLRSLNQIADLDFPELKYAPFRSETAPELRDVDLDSSDSFFTALRKGEILLHHPYQSFTTSVVNFLENAARDPHVLAIKQTLYRTSGDSPIVQALIEAAEAGKQVLAVIEIRARFDEMANVRWARKLEEVGVHVVYGLMGLKTHAKLSLVVREEGDTLRRYCHVGTGNYNPKTARFYDDLGILSADPVLGEDLSRLFNELSGYSTKHEYSRLLVAPHSLRKGLIARIKRETRHHLDGKPAWIRFKLNSLLDEEIIDQLYEAADAGVKVEIVVRGICSIRLNTQARRENIKVRSILGRFLEHSRIYYFRNGGAEDYYIGSADMMHRNLDRRVESLVLIESEKHKQRLAGILDDSVSDKYSTWKLTEENNWVRNIKDHDGNLLVNFQDHFIDRHNRS